MILRDVGGTIRLKETTGGTPTVTAVRDSTGATAATGSASGSDGDWTFTLTAAQVPEVELLTVEWVYSGKTWRTQEEVVGGFICSVDDIDAALPPNHTKTTEEIEKARDWAEGIIERACGVAFRPRYARETLDGSGGTSLFLANPRSTAVLAASIADTALTLSDVEADPVGTLSYSSWTAGSRNVSVAYVHGHSSPPEPIRSACIRLARYHLLEDPSNAFERATSYTTEDATYSLVTPGVRGAETPIPEVNAAIEQFRYVLSIA